MAGADPLGDALKPAFSQRQVEAEEAVADVAEYDLL